MKSSRSSCGVSAGDDDDDDDAAEDGDVEAAISSERRRRKRGRQVAAAADAMDDGSELVEVERQLASVRASELPPAVLCARPKSNRNAVFTRLSLNKMKKKSFTTHHHRLVNKISTSGHCTSRLLRVVGYY